MKRILILIGLMLIISGCSKAEVKLLDIDAFASLIEDEDVFLLNTHTPYEGEIDGTDAIIEDWENIGLNINKLPDDKNKPIAVYCRSGRMSAVAAEQLIDLGYKNVYDLKNGMIGWKESGREIVEK